MKKLHTKETFAGTRIDILNEAGDVLTSIDYLSFDSNKMDMKLFAGQLVNAWNNTYGEGIEPRGVPDLLEELKLLLKYVNEVGDEHGYWPDHEQLNDCKYAIKKAQPE